MDNHLADQSPQQAENQQQIPPPPSQLLLQQQQQLIGAGFNDGCEVCMAEAWWRMASYQNTLLQHQAAQAGLNPTPDSSAIIQNNYLLEFDSYALAAMQHQFPGYIGSFATTETPNNNQPGSDCAQQPTITGPPPAPSDFSLSETAAAMMISQEEGGVPPKADFSMPKLREFFEIQKALGVPNFPDDFDEFWLLVVKARLFNIFKNRGPDVYNRIVIKIRDIVRNFMAQVEEREAKEAVEQINNN